MTTPLTYRFHEESDIPALLRLWGENTEWGSLTREQWSEWYVDTPHGASLVAVGVDQQTRIRAQGVSTPALLSIGDDTLSTCRLTAVILDKELRAFTKRHPILCLVETLKQGAIAQNRSLSYAYPHATLGPFLRRYMPELEMDTFGCVAVEVSSCLDFESGQCSVSPAFLFGAEYQELWLQSKRDFPIVIGFIRSPAWLRYRLAGQLALEARSSTGSLLGYASFDRKGLLTDCLSRNRDDMKAVLSACLAWLARNRGDLKRVKAMRAPFIAPVLDTLGFMPDDYEFLFARQVLNPNLSAAQFDLNAWHLMPAD